MVKKNRNIKTKNPYNKQLYTFVRNNTASALSNHRSIHTYAITDMDTIAAR